MHNPWNIQICSLAKSMALACALATTACQTSVAQQARVDEGFTEPSMSSIVASPESGVLTEISVSEGDRVEVDTIIACLDSLVLQASVQAAEQRLNSLGKLNAAQATLTNKANRLTQMKELLDKEHASDKEVQQAQLEFDVAKANLEAQRDELNTHQMELQKIKAQLERRIIRSPIRGIVLEVPGKIGEAVNASDSHVATVVALDQLRVRYFLTTAQAIALNRGDRLNVRFPDTQQHATAEVDFISPVTDSKSGTVRVELLIENANAEYRSGLRCVIDQTPSRSTSRQTAQKPSLNQQK